MVALTEELIKKKTNASSLDDIKNLNLWGSHLSDVSILSSMQNVEVLSLSMNRIVSLEALSKCSKLQELYLRKNEVKSLEEIQHLEHLKDLRVLWLCDNPCADEPDYRARVVQFLPHLHKLDHAGVTDAEREAATAVSRPKNPLLTPPPTAKQDDKDGEAVAKPEEARVVCADDSVPGGGCPPASQLDGGDDAVRGDAKKRVAGSKGAASNILYAVMALLGELDVEALTIVKTDVDERMNALI